MIGALLRMPWERVVRRMFERLHADGFDDLDMAHMNLLLPQLGQDRFAQLKELLLELNQPA
jgi:hypothetical protein